MRGTEMIVRREPSDGSIQLGVIEGHAWIGNRNTREIHYLQAGQWATDGANWWTKAVVAADGMSMSGVTEAGDRVSAVRLQSCSGVAGSWRWENGKTFALTGDGRWTITNGNGIGTWRCQVNNNGENEVIITPDGENWWTKAVVAADGMSMSGVTENGDRVSAARTSP